MIGTLNFTDGIERPVYEDDQGQYVLDEGERVYGVWLLADEPLVVERCAGF